MCHPALLWAWHTAHSTSYQGMHQGFFPVLLNTSWLMMVLRTLLWHKPLKCLTMEKLQSSLKYSTPGIKNRKNKTLVLFIISEKVTATLEIIHQTLFLTDKKTSKLTVINSRVTFPLKAPKNDNILNLNIWICFVACDKNQTQSYDQKKKNILQSQSYTPPQQSASICTAMVAWHR